MARRLGLVMLRVVACFFLVIFGYIFLADPVRALEAKITVWFFQAVGVTRVSDVFRYEILSFPPDGTPFSAVVTTSCSALPAVLAVAGLGLFILYGKPAKRILAVVTASILIILANLVRIIGSVGAGLWSGESSLVLFHDWVGTLFGLAYTLLGFLVLIAMMLPKQTSGTVRISS